MPDFSATILADSFESPILFALSPLKADLSESDSKALKLFPE